MIGRRRMPRAVQAELFRRLSTAMAAGVGLRRAWESEARRVPARWRPAMHEVAAALVAGASLSDALGRVAAFPSFVVAVVAVGDRTGRDAEVLADLAADLAAAERARGRLRAALVRPALQLVVAAAAVAVLILVSGSGGTDGTPGDMLGLGLAGRSGLVRFASMLALVVVLGAVVVRWATWSWSERGVVRRLAVWLPIVGPAVTAAEAAAWCRAASLADHAGMGPGPLVDLAAAAAPGLRHDRAAVAAALRDGATLDEALATTGRLPARVLQAVAVGEQTGTLAETLARLATQLDEEARAGLAASVTALGWLVWAGAAALAALVVYRFFCFYAGMIEAAGRPL